MASNNIYKIRDSFTNSTKYKTEKIHACLETYYRNVYSQPKMNDKDQILFKPTKSNGGPKLSFDKGNHNRRNYRNFRTISRDFCYTISTLRLMQRCG